MRRILAVAGTTSITQSHDHRYSIGRRTTTVVLPGGTRIVVAVRLVRRIAEEMVSVTFLHLSARDGRVLDAYYARARAEQERLAAA